MHLVINTANKHVIRKRSLHISNSTVHVALKRGTSIPQTKRQPLVLKQHEWGGDGHLGYVRRVDWDLMITLPEIDFGKNRAASCLSCKI
jgi:hypothetical protein